MSQIEFKEAEVRGWRGLRMTRGELSLGFAPEIGGRLVSLIYQGEELLFVQEEHAGEEFDFPKGIDLAKEKKRLGFRLWGGDKTWVSPQSQWEENIPPLDLDAGPYTYNQRENHLVMQSKICRETKLKISRLYALDEDGSIFLEETFHNTTDRPILRGIWNVTQVLRPFNVYIPVPWDQVIPYSEEGASIELKSSYVKDASVILCQDPVHFKYGMTPEQGVVIAYREKANQRLHWERRFKIDKEAHYAHKGAVEVYNSPNYPYLEIEVHAPLKAIQPGESYSHQQRWRFYTQPLNK